jgi:hypothetical protein
MYSEQGVLIACISNSIVLILYGDAGLCVWLCVAKILSGYLEKR